jgi:hypothetical protein
MISAAVLQIIAVISMTIDHIGYYLFPDCLILRILGRIAFPIFAFMLVEGFKYTRSRPRYFARLLVAAMVAQLVFFAFSEVFHYDYMHNVIFTFAFALVALICAERGGFFLIAVPLLILAAGALECEYGLYGTMMIVCLYYAGRIFGNNRYLRPMAQAVVIIAMMSSQALLSAWDIQLFSLFAIVPIALYSGKKGQRLPRLFGYFYYPMHLAVLFLVKLLFF